MKINNCRCGRKAKIEEVYPLGHFISCPRTSSAGYRTCWVGPVRKTEREAIKAWNKVMEKKK